MDRRKNKTLESIEQAFFKNLEKKPAAKITVTDICREANINRSTFYDYFEDMPDYINFIENKVVKRCLEIASLYKFNKNTTAMLDEWFLAIKENKNLFGFMFQENRISCWKRYVEVLKKKTIPVWLENSDLNESEVNLVLDYMFGGAYQVIKTWLDSGCEMDMSDLKSTFDNVVKYGVYHFIYVNP